MKSKSIIASVAVGLFVIGISACDRDGPAERAGAKIDNAADKSANKMENAADKMGDKMEKAGDKVQGAARDAKN
ncbi:MAG: hypothetical protein H7X91_12335 [Burkholderiales bacterium]|nr:hypothetical protein [Burkholderiales bacterium]